MDFFFVWLPRCFSLTVFDFVSLLAVNTFIINLFQSPYVGMASGQAFWSRVYNYLGIGLDRFSW